jgi:hypothetical protein
VQRALDGEATPVELEALHADPRLSGALDGHRRVVEQLTAPVTPLSDTAVDAMVARALTQGGLDSTQAGRTAPVDQPASLADRRRRSQPIRWGGWAAAAAAVVLLLGLGTVLARAMSSSSSSDMASSGSAASTAAEDRATLESARPESGGENASSAADRSPTSTTTAVPSAPQLATLRPQDAGVASTIDELVDRALATQAFTGANPTVETSQDAERLAASDDLAACLEARAIDGTIERWVRGSVDGQTIDVLVLSRPLGPQVYAIGPVCTIERARAV